MELLTQNEFDRTVDLLRKAYAVLAWTPNDWPHRSSIKGQELLANLRDNIAMLENISPQEVQDSADETARQVLL